MHKIEILNNLKGEVVIPPSKSVLHRALILASFSEHNVVINNVNYSLDIKATLNCLESLGINFIKRKDSITVIPSKFKKISDLDANESGSTLRFMIPLMLLLDEEISITGHNELKKRPLDAYIELFNEFNIKYEYDGLLPLTIKGKLEPNTYHLKGDKSSQFISGLLMVLPFLDGDSKVLLTTKLESKQYVDITIKEAREFGILIEEIDGGYFIKGKQKVKINSYTVEGDYSQAAFFLVANCLGADLKLKGLKRPSLQGDEKILYFLEQAGFYLNSDYKVIRKDLKSVCFSLKENPDLAPILGLLLSILPNESKLIDLERLAYKESNRLLSTYELLKQIGVDVRIEDASLVIKHTTNYKEGFIDTFNDHRIVMTSFISTLLTKTNYINEYSPVNKSFPDFVSIFTNLGGLVYSSLDSARLLINEADLELKEAFLKRFKGIKEVLNYKIKNKLPVYDEKREKEVIERNMTNFNDDFLAKYYLEFIEFLLKISKEYQSEHYE